MRGSLGPTAIDPGQARLIQPRSMMSERAARTLAFSSMASPEQMWTGHPDPGTDGKERRGGGMPPFISMKQHIPVLLSQHSEWR